MRWPLPRARCCSRGPSPGHSCRTARCRVRPAGAAPSCTAKRCAAFMRFYGFLGCPGLVEPKLVRIIDRAVHPEGQVARLSLLDPAWVLQQQLLHFLGSSLLGDHPDEVSDRAYRWPAPLGCRGWLLHCRDALSDPDRRARGLRTGSARQQQSRLTTRRHGPRGMGSSTSAGRSPRRLSSAGGDAGQRPGSKDDPGEAGGDGGSQRPG